MSSVLKYAKRINHQDLVTTYLAPVCSHLILKITLRKKQLLQQKDHACFLFLRKA